MKIRQPELKPVLVRSQQDTESEMQDQGSRNDATKGGGIRTQETSFVSRENGSKLTPISRRNITIDKIDSVLANELGR